MIGPMYYTLIGAGPLTRRESSGIETGSQCVGIEPRGRPVLLCALYHPGTGIEANEGLQAVTYNRTNFVTYT